MRLAEGPVSADSLARHLPAQRTRLCTGRDPESNHHLATINAGTG
jgi:hypothetical protein